jgi:hypothetical protein
MIVIEPISLTSVAMMRSASTRYGIRVIGG